MLNIKNTNSKCACSGIRKCGVCAPDLVKKELDQEKELLSKSKQIFIYCVKCNLSTRITSSNEIENFECCCQKPDGVNNKIKIEGISIFENFLTESEESFLIDEINKAKWVESQSGRFKQDFGPKANFNKKKLKYSTFTGLPIYSKFIIDRLYTLDKNNIKDFVPVELCNLKYDSSRSACIEPHYDDFWLWGNRLITVNLLSSTYLTLTPGKDVSNTINENCEVLLPLERYSVIILSDEARYKWLHSIKKSHIKSTRLAITLRELSDEFKLESVGSLIEKLALTFKGVSVGEIEDFFRVKNEPEFLINKPVNFINLRDEIQEKCRQFEYFDVEHNKSVQTLTEDDIFEIGKIIAEWRIFSNENFGDLKFKFKESKSIDNLGLIKYDFEAFKILLRNVVQNSKLDLSLKSKLVAIVHILRVQFENIENFDNFTGIIFGDFKPFNCRKIDGNLKFTTSFENLSFSFYLNDLAIFISKYLVESNQNFGSLLNGYESILNLNCLSEPKSILNNLVLVNLILTALNLKDDLILPKISNLIETLFLEKF